MIARDTVDYILQLNSTYDSCMTNRMLLKVDMTDRLLLKVDFPYDDDINNNKHDIERRRGVAQALLVV